MSVCKECGKQVIWGVTPEGKNIPLDPNVPVYTPVKRHGRDELIRNTMAYPGHLPICEILNGAKKEPE